MKWLKDIENFIGSTIEECYMVESINYNLSKEGNSWISIMLKDLSGRIHAKLWKEKIKEGVDYDSFVGRVVKINAFVDVYNGEPSLALQTVELADEDDYDMSQYALSLGKEDKEEYWKRLLNHIASIEDEGMRLLVETIFKYFKERMCGLPAGKTMHHAYNGALLVHTLEVTEIALATYEVMNRYNKSYTVPLHRDFVLCGALLHDIGKVVEYEAFPGCGITLRGSLIGHLVEGVKCINSFNGFLKEKAVPVKKMNILEHLILSSHGGLGGGCKPATKEGIIIKNADNMSAEIDGYDTVFRLHDEKHPGNNEKSVKNTYTGNYSVRGWEEF